MENEKDKFFEDLFDACAMQNKEIDKMHEDYKKSQAELLKDKSEEEKREYYNLAFEEVKEFSKKHKTKKIKAKKK